MEKKDEQIMYYFGLLFVLLSAIILGFRYFERSNLEPGQVVLVLIMLCLTSVYTGLYLVKFYNLTKDKPKKDLNYY